MSVYWEHLAGDTSRFAIRLSLARDPDTGEGATSDEAASWGSFQVWVHNRNLCAHLESNEQIDSVHWYLIELVEWVANNWDPLLHEERLPVGVGGSNAVQSLNRTKFGWGSAPATAAPGVMEEWQDWWFRHSIQAARSGGPFPNIVFRRWRDEVEVSWDSDDLPSIPDSAGVIFLDSRGTGRFPPEEVASALYDIATEAARELHKRHPQSARFKELHQTLGDLASEDRAKIRCAWLAGLGWAPGGVLESWERISNQLGETTQAVRQAIFGASSSPLAIDKSPAAALLFGAVAPEVQEEDIPTLLGVLKNAATDPTPTAAAYAELAEAFPLPYRAHKLHEQALNLAEYVLMSLDVSRASAIDIEHLVAGLGIAIKTEALADRKIRAVSVAGEVFRPTIVLNAHFPWSDKEVVRRFTIAHELCHVLFDQDRTTRVVVASGAWAPREVEQRANAFAANLLMPPELVRTAIEQTKVEISSAAGIVSVARFIKTSPSATLEHLGNLGFLDESVVEQLRNDLHWQRMEDYWEESQAG